MSEHEPSVHAMRAAEVIENEYDLSNGAAEYQVPYVAEIIERETGVGVAAVMIETADQIIRRLLQNPHDPETQAAAGRWRAAFILRTKPTN